MKLIALALGTLILLFNIMYVSGAAGYNYPLLITPNKCEFVSVQAQGVQIEAGQEATLYASIKNNSDWPFYLDEASFKANNSFITVKGITSSLTVGPGQTGLVKATVHAVSNAGGKSSTVQLQVLGHLQNGQYCDSQSIEAILIPVSIQSLNTPDVCSLTKLIVPQTVEYQAGQSAVVSVAFQNDQSTSAVIKAHNNMADVTPSVVGISANQSGSVTFTVRNFTEKQSFTFFDLEQTGCETKSYVVLMKQDSDQNTPIVTPPVTGSMQVSLDGNVTIVPADGSYQVAVTVQNQGNQPLTGFVGLNLPQNWTTQNPVRIQLNPNQSTVVSFSVKPSSPTTSSNVGQIVFTFPNQTTQTKSITFPSSAGAVGLAFAFLGGNWFGLGILLLLLLVLFLWSARSSKVVKQSGVVVQTTDDEPLTSDDSEEVTTKIVESESNTESKVGEPHVWADGQHPVLPETHVTTSQAKNASNMSPSQDFEAWLDHQVSQLR